MSDDQWHGVALSVQPRFDPCRLMPPLCPVALNGIADLPRTPDAAFLPKPPGCRRSRIVDGSGQFFFAFVMRSMLVVGVSSSAETSGGTMGVARERAYQRERQGNRCAPIRARGSYVQSSRRRSTQVES